MKLTDARKKRITLLVEHLLCVLKKNSLMPLILFSSTEFKAWKQRQLDYAKKMYDDTENEGYLGLCHTEEPSMLYFNIAAHETEADLENSVIHEILHLCKPSYTHTKQFKNKIKKLQKGFVKNGRIIK